MASAASDWGLPTWKLIFDAGTQLHGADSPYLWGFKSSKPSHVFRNLLQPLTSLIPAADNVTIANSMKDWYLGFVLNLDPNSISNSGTPKPYWPQYQVSNGTNFTVMDVNYTMIGINPDPDASVRCDFFHGQSYVVRN